MHNHSLASVHSSSRGATHVHTHKHKHTHTHSAMENVRNFLAKREPQPVYFYIFAQATHRLLFDTLSSVAFYINHKYCCCFIFSDICFPRQLRAFPHPVFSSYFSFSPRSTFTLRYIFIKRTSKLSLSRFQGRSGSALSRYLCG